MADIYTDITNGNDITGDGSAGTPYQTIQVAIDNANGGDTIWIGDSATNTLASQLSWASGFGGVQDTSPDAHLTLRGWDYSGGAAADGIAVIDGNSLAGILAAAKNYVTWYHLKISGTDGASHSCLLSGAYNTFIELEISDITGVGSYAINVAAASYGTVLYCVIRDVVKGINSRYSVRGCVIVNHSDTAITVASNAVITHNTTVSAGGSGIVIAGEGVVVTNNAIIGDGITASVYGINIGSTRESCVITDNTITGWGGTTNVGVNNPAGNAIAVLGNNHYKGNTLDETAGISGDVNIYLSSAGTGPGFVSSGGGASAAAVADAVLEELIASHSGVSGSLAERMTRIPDVAAAASGGLPTVDANNRIAGIAGTVVNTLDEIAGSSFVEATHGLDQTASTTDVATAQYDVLVATTIATLASQTSFTLTAGSTDDAYTDALCVVEDASTSVQKAFVSISDYTGATKTVTLSASPAFTIATTDKVRILAAPTGASVAALTDGVWDEDIVAAHTTADTAGAILSTDRYWVTKEFIAGTTTDKYRAIRWHKNATILESGVTSPLIRVVSAEDGAELIAETALSEAGSSHLYKYDATGAELGTSGVAYAIRCKATIDGSVRTFEETFVRA